MLVILFKLGEQEYAIDTQTVIEVVPYVPLKKVLGVDPAMSGLLHYRDDLAPVIDLGILATGKPAEAFYSTRILLLEHRGRTGGLRTVGVIAENVLETHRVEKESLKANLMTPSGKARVGPFFHLGKRIIQVVEVDALLTDSIERSLEVAPRALPAGSDGGRER